MISNVIFYEVGLGQRILMADNAARAEVPVLVVSPKALHESWRRDFRQLGVDASQIELITPQRVAGGAADLSAYRHVFVDELHSENWDRLTDMVRDTERPVTILMSLWQYLALAPKIERSLDVVAERIVQHAGDDPLFVRCDEDAARLLVGDVDAEYDSRRGGIEAKLTKEAVLKVLQFPADFSVAFTSGQSVASAAKARDCVAAAAQRRNAVASAEGPTI